ncbi:hypothetical protein BGZ83_010738 [Gryganskiella cystojenkinii]|nr:hypothetical protein BGZ83_010738 [Gryganskiella cystojenkinii]
MDPDDHDRDPHISSDPPAKKPKLTEPKHEPNLDALYNLSALLTTSRQDRRPHQQHPPKSRPLSAPSLSSSTTSKSISTSDFRAKAISSATISLNRGRVSSSNNNSHSDKRQSSLVGHDASPAITSFSHPTRLTQPRHHQHTKSTLPFSKQRPSSVITLSDNRTVSELAASNRSTSSPSPNGNHLPIERDRLATAAPVKQTQVQPGSIVPAKRFVVSDTTVTWSRSAPEAGFQLQAYTPQKASPPASSNPGHQRNIGTSTALEKKPIVSKNGSSSASTLLTQVSPERYTNGGNNRNNSANTIRSPVPVTIPKQSSALPEKPELVIKRNHGSPNAMTAMITNQVFPGLSNRHTGDGSNGDKNNGAVSSPRVPTIRKEKMIAKAVPNKEHSATNVTSTLQPTTTQTSEVPPGRRVVGSRDDTVPGSRSPMPLTIPPKPGITERKSSGPLQSRSSSSTESMPANQSTEIDMSKLRLNSESPTSTRPKGVSAITGKVLNKTTLGAYHEAYLSKIKDDFLASNRGRATLHIINNRHKPIADDVTPVLSIGDDIAELLNSPPVVSITDTDTERTTTAPHKADDRRGGSPALQMNRVTSENVPRVEVPQPSHVVKSKSARYGHKGAIPKMANGLSYQSGTNSRPIEISDGNSDNAQSRRQSLTSTDDVDYISISSSEYFDAMPFEEDDSDPDEVNLVPVKEESVEYEATDDEAFVYESTPSEESRMEPCEDDSMEDTTRGDEYHMVAIASYRKSATQLLRYQREMIQERDLKLAAERRKRRADLPPGFSELEMKLIYEMVDSFLSQVQPVNWLQIAETITDKVGVIRDPEELQNAFEYSIRNYPQTRPPSNRLSFDDRIPLTKLLKRRETRREKTPLLRDIIVRKQFERYEEAARFNFASGSVVDLAVKADNGHLKIAIASTATPDIYNRDGNLVLCDLNKGKARHLRGHSVYDSTFEQTMHTTVNEVALSFSKKFFLSVSNDHRTKVINGDL